MRRIVTVDALSRRSPTIVAVTLGIALLASWFGAPLVVPYGLALIVGGIAIVVMAASKRNARLNADLEAAKTESWIAQELAGQYGCDQRLQADDQGRKPGRHAPVDGPEHGSEIDAVHQYAGACGMQRFLAGGPFRTQNGHQGS